jgi:2-dehydropantoate 2-reductase
MRILVIGGGAIGTLYAARLSRAHEVSLVVHRPGQADAIRRDGVRVTGLEEVVAQVDVTTDVPAPVPDTLVLLTTKVYDNADAVRPLLPLVRSDTVILCLQNGLDGDRVVRALVDGRCAVLRGITNFGAVHVRAGVVDLKARGDTIVEAGPTSAALASMFTECGLAGRVSPDIKRDVWVKLLVNCVINPLTAMTGMEVGWIADARLDPLKQRIVNECAAVARCEGVHLEGDIVQRLNQTYGPSTNLSSMLQDLSNGRRTEIDQMNGAVVETGRRHGVACPVNEALVAIVKALELRA